jgi:hypothetical protein
MWVIPDLEVQEMILALETDLNIFPAAGVVRLYTNDFTPTKSNVVGDFTQLTNVEVPGYVAVALAWGGTPVRKQDGSWEDLGALINYSAAGGPPPAPIVVYGWYLTDAGNTAVFGSGRFASPFTFSADGDGFNLEPTFNALQQSGMEYLLTLDMEVE